MSEKTILVFFGGCSGEYEVSLSSGKEVLSAMEGGPYRPVPVGITREGRWLYYTGPLERIPEDKWQTEHCVPCTLDVSRGSRSLLLLDGSGRRLCVDAAFPVLHGKNGEDGTIQGLLELADIPVVGCGTLASALCMDKDRSHRLAAAAGVRVPRNVSFPQGADPAAVRAAAGEIGYPVFVKPVRGGSSLGVSKVESENGLAAAVEAALACDSAFIIEEAIVGIEVGCAVMGNQGIFTGEIDEIEVTEGFFGYEEKYTFKNSRILCPARITDEQSQALKETAMTVYRVLGCRGFARVDMFLTEDGQPVFSEVNTIPGFTSHSQYPRMMGAIGMSFRKVVERVIALALEEGA